MTDRYLFKAKTKILGDWIVGYLVPAIGADSGNWLITEIIKEGSADSSCTWLIDPSTICQCTGLKDKDGKLIWENDIVRYTWTDGQGMPETEVVTVKYDNYGFKPFIWEYDCDGCNLYCETLEVEVIGNKFDNPILLEGKHENI